MMAVFVTAIHEIKSSPNSWIAGTRPAMTRKGLATGV
jgi:hypothetical protein